ncbi:heavy-metal-associated domain-containing protein [Metabacillus herbersteinensis]|uniref:Heavy-metal-associated domain-containing protein n=1 Tax=Metabacillus herbersteinensis TaxID=283816 RepID=A0ABV6GBP8_9BACI
METKKTLLLKKMNTEEDAKRISEILHDVWGIRNVEIQLDTGKATVSYDEDAASIQDFQQAITDSGHYEVINEEGPIKQ